jgi:hypothetical protein
VEEVAAAGEAGGDVLRRQLHQLVAHRHVAHACGPSWSPICARPSAPARGSTALPDRRRCARAGVPPPAAGAPARQPNASRAHDGVPRVASRSAVHCSGRKKFLRVFFTCRSCTDLHGFTVSRGRRSSYSAASASHAISSRQSRPPTIPTIACVFAAYGSSVPFSPGTRGR